MKNITIVALAVIALSIGSLAALASGDDEDDRRLELPDPNPECLVVDRLGDNEEVKVVDCTTYVFEWEYVDGTTSVYPEQILVARTWKTIRVFTDYGDYWIEVPTSFEWSQGSKFVADSDVERMYCTAEQARNESWGQCDRDRPDLD